MGRGVRLAQAAGGAHTPLRSARESWAAFNAAMICRAMPARDERAWAGLVHRSFSAAPQVVDAAAHSGEPASGLALRERRPRRCRTPCRPTPLGGPTLLGPWRPGERTWWPVRRS